MKAGVKLSALLPISVIMFSGSAYAETVFYCSTEHAVGYVNEDGWKQTNFKLERYTIKFSDDFSQVVGLPLELWDCHPPYPAYPEETVCHPKRDPGYTFLFNTTNLRFALSLVSTSGWIGSELEPDTDYLSLGTCVKF